MLAAGIAVAFYFVVISGPGTPIARPNSKQFWRKFAVAGYPASSSPRISSSDAMAAGGIMFERHQGHRSVIEVADRLHHDR
jgi:hypothetical protein